ncbi:MAG: DUF1015 domain-containing protein [Spirochaetota bacterium]
METLDKRFARLGIKIPRIVLPFHAIDLKRWAVVACDQFTSEKKYWEEVENFVAASPSALRLILPECFLKEKDTPKRIRTIHKEMKKYLNNGLLVEYEPAFILVKRDTPLSPPRWGLMAALDLEYYDFSASSKSIIRPTEGIIHGRLPPRVKIRRDAPLELSHIIVLIDDPWMSIIEKLAEEAETLEKIYDFDLMMNSGHLTGYRLHDDKHLHLIVSGMEKLADPAYFRKRYASEDLLLFAVGDGNHSLATAKSIWERIKLKNTGDPAIMDNPARWALVELVNIYSQGLIVEPIHRVLFNVDPAIFFQELKQGREVTVQELLSFNALENRLEKHITKPGSHVIGFVMPGKQGLITVHKPSSRIATGIFQPILDIYLKNHPESSVDYIHGVTTVENLGRRDGNMGLIFPPIDKSQLFQTIISEGVLPRKTFSIGRAQEKRFYVEARKIVNCLFT